MDNISKLKARGETESGTFSLLLVGGALLLATLAADCCLVFMGPYESTSDASFEKEAAMPSRVCAAKGFDVHEMVHRVREPNESIFVVLKALMENKTPLKLISEVI